MGLTETNPKRMARTVSKDEVGNPIVPGIASLMDAPMNSRVDEDGVQLA
jgi:hypothetical protein